VDRKQKALVDLQQHLQSPPILIAPREGEQLLLYITATTHIINMAIVVDRPEEGHVFKVQKPVHEAAILITSMKFCHYFNECNISIVTDFQLEDIHHNRDATGCISK
jgi:hypothetical protein